MINFFKQIRRNFKKKKNRRKKLLKQQDKSNQEYLILKSTSPTEVLVSPEFLIKRIEICENEFYSSFGLNDQNSLKILTPNDIDYQVEMSLTHYIIKMENVSYSFSEEMDGILISFDGSLTYEFAKQIIAQLKLNLERLQNNEAEVVEIIY